MKKLTPSDRKYDMRLTHSQKYEQLRKQYSTIIGWGAGAEFQRYYDHDLLRFDHMIDGAGKNIGIEMNGIMIQSIETLIQYKNNDSLLVVIYPNIENEILPQISEFLPKADTIVARLLDIEDRETSYSANEEDHIMLDYIRTKRSDFSYMDIGVCHPIVRNNTFLFYEKGFTKGVLVEPNTEMCSMAAEYRPLNKIVNMGASPVPTDEELIYYYDSMHPGLNTFLKDVAVSRGMDQSFRKVPMKDINSIIAENFESYPNILDIDTEGLDFDLLSHLDFDKYPIDLVCVEASAGDRIRKLMTEKGYRLLEVTRENEIYAIFAGS